eukprot:TRINITY_DN10580_c0_g1_i1.p1 TRINITY_DN10580_c0_g1~~TRINITY_DN10580_c0_g1_i1.p1  ORF type:complete len:245 (-),score=58.85 TRINITY_DN10580_c0_g1_i1:106-840(-)
MSNNFSESVLIEAGIASGMKVLDIGCGNGNFTFVVSNLVGESGLIVGYDREEELLNQAQQTSEEKEINNVRFVLGDLSDLSNLEEGDFDAVVCRRVLMYLPDRVEILTVLKSFLKPGGLFVLIEADSTMIPQSVVPMPLHDKVIGWLWNTVEKEGADVSMGFHLTGVMKEAGISVDNIRVETGIQGFGGNALHIIAGVMIPRLEKHGVATAEEVDIDTLEDRLKEERKDNMYVSDMTFAVWGHI